MDNEKVVDFFFVVLIIGLPCFANFLQANITSLYSNLPHMFKNGGKKINIWQRSHFMLHVRHVQFYYPIR
jgi:hypothetical protein